MTFLYLWRHANVIIVWALAILSRMGFLQTTWIYLVSCYKLLRPFHLMWQSQAFFTPYCFQSLYFVFIKLFFNSWCHHSLFPFYFFLSPYLLPTPTCLQPAVITSAAWHVCSLLVHGCHLPGSGFTTSFFSSLRSFINVFSLSPIHFSTSFQNLLLFAC